MRDSAHNVVFNSRSRCILGKIYIFEIAPEISSVYWIHSYGTTDIFEKVGRWSNKSNNII